MARLEHSDSFTTARSPQDAQQAALNYFASIGAQVGTVSPNYVEASSGSQAAIRVKGGLFAKGADYPMRMSATIEPDGDGSKVSLNLVDTLGFGIKAGLRNGYRAEFGAKAQAIRTAIEGGAPATPAPPPSAPADTGAEAANSPLAQELEKLAALHASGALTDEEFTAGKERLLGGT